LPTHVGGGHAQPTPHAGAAIPSVHEEALHALKQRAKALAKPPPGAQPAAVEALRGEVQSRALALLEASPGFAATAGVLPSMLWKHTMYAPLSGLRSALKKVRGCLVW
jgi:hypothetical protein